MKDYLLKINKLIEIKKISQLELSQMIGKNKNTLSNYFTGKTKIDVDTLHEIANALGVPVGYFFNDETPTSKVLLQSGNNNVMGNANKIENTDKDKLNECIKENQILKERLLDKEQIIKLLMEKK